MNTTVRNFILGDEWIYLKIYAGPKFLEKILINDIKNFIEYLYNTKLIDKFFFIRYFDEDYHLRLRFKIILPFEQNNDIISELSKIFQPYLTENIIWKISFDTYSREIERYGSKSIENIETLFSMESLSILYTLKILENEEEFGEDTRWLYAVKLVNFLLVNFNLNYKSRIEILESYSNLMLNEFNVDKFGKKSLNDFYREKRKIIEDILEDNIPTNIDHLLKETTEKEAWKNSVSTLLEMKKQGHLEVNFESLIHSVIHMTNNRIFRSNQRQNELYVYYLMAKSLKSINAKKKNYDFK